MLQCFWPVELALLSPSLYEEKSRGGQDGPRTPLAPGIVHCVPQELFLGPLSFCNRKEPFLRVQVAGVQLVEWKMAPSKQEAGRKVVAVLVLYKALAAFGKASAAVGRASVKHALAGKRC